MSEEIKLTPSLNGIDCIGNGQHGIECQCDECDFFLECFPEGEINREEYDQWRYH